MTVQGMDVEQVRQMTMWLHQMSDELEQSTQRASVIIDNVVGSGWQGPDAHQFRGDFASGVRPALQHAADQVRQLAQRARMELLQQEAASQT